MHLLIIVRLENSKVVRSIHDTWVDWVYPWFLMPGHNPSDWVAHITLSGIIWVTSVFNTSWVHEIIIIIIIIIIIPSQEFWRCFQIVCLWLQAPKVVSKSLTKWQVLLKEWKGKVQFTIYSKDFVTFMLTCTTSICPFVDCVTNFAVGKIDRSLYLVYTNSTTMALGCLENKDP